MSFARKKVVIDSNIIVSAAIYPNSASANALRLAVVFCAQSLTVTLPPVDPAVKTF